MANWDVPDQPCNPPERDYLQERIDYLEATADEYNDLQREAEEDATI